MRVLITGVSGFVGSALPIFPMSQIDDFFRSRSDQVIDLRKPLAVLATHIPW